MNIKNLFDKKEVVFSFEIFPPKQESRIDTIYNTLEELKGLKPDFISVTYGAGGSLSKNMTCEISSIVKNKYKIEPLAHLTCINSNKNQVNTILDNLKQSGIENILALRGDIPSDYNGNNEFEHASDLIKHIKQRDNFNIVAACYPERHLDSISIEDDLINLKKKQEAGATHLISQLFFDNEYFYRFLEEKDKYNIDVPIQAGIMPVINTKQINRIVSLCGAKLPKKFIKIMNKYEFKPEALRDAGIAYATEQIIDLISSGVDGIHLYTMNNSYVAKRISTSIFSILDTINNCEGVIN
ncbi:methylenetetrahydrofolate reductase [NAD(P)H] [Clostridium sp. D46t1_190503_E9]|uniref:methylenetetrahydrofolate reductase [NAD(P)H] n=1 Tax=Clostridium sp. D46t1_190503_E9 TaxID=2787137 RepID=UPI00189A35B9|nr:methylenetetrahydrofolate reductase [NAD(P)H] [Clostridium sp. D46t1_190503_E9]